MAIVIVSLLLSVVLLVNYTPFQNFLVHRATKILSDKLKTHVALQHVRLDLLNHILIQGLYIEDQAHDTMLYAGEVQLRLTDWFVFKEKPVLHYMALSDAYTHLYRTPLSNEWNYDFIVDAFSSPSTHKKDTTSSSFDFDLKKIKLDNIRFHYDDAWGGEDMNFDVGSIELNTDIIDMKKKIIDVKEIAIKNTLVGLREYKRSSANISIQNMDSTVNKDSIVKYDATPFNPAHWSISVNKTSLYNCGFNFINDNSAMNADSTLFDENHMKIHDIQLLVSKMHIDGDTIHANIEHLAANERCGLTIKNLKSSLTVSPVASIMDNLSIETKYSKIGHYYAMHYKHFPSFLQYIDSVKMTAKLRGSVIDSRDIAYFAPVLREYPAILNVSGEMKGTVRTLEAKDLDITDGLTTLKGNIAIDGLPDINVTNFNYTNATIHTSGAGIIKYAPELKNNPNVDIESIKNADFAGSFNGLIDNFVLKGVLNTNLGNVTTAFHLDIPGFKANQAKYSGNISCDHIQIGQLLRLSLIGDISLEQKFSGSSFLADEAQTDIDGTISEFTIKGYTYHNITSKGVLAKKQFTGSLLVDDPNLALEFDGYIDYSKTNIIVNTKAHLLNANFKMLNLTTDTLTAAADFDLDFRGSNIDSFLGYAKLYNIDMKRNQHRLNIDSVYVTSTIDSKGKTLSVQSNDITGYVQGNYQLSKLPASIQYYLSRYLPNYIPAPSKFAPDQDMEFEISTINVDSIFAVAYPLIRGFDSSKISGSLNTNEHKLTLIANIPYVIISKTHFTNINISGDGNLDLLALNVNIDNVSLNDSAFNSSLSLTTTIGNDSLQFTIATTTPDTGASITLNGQIQARKDSLFLSLAPSQFYLGTSEWSIGLGSRVVYSDKYISVHGLSLISGLQKITISSPENTNLSSIVINTENLDLGQLGTWAGLSSYQPDGRMNGIIKVEDIFNHLVISSNMKATNVKMGTDTIGSINIIGSYDNDKKLIKLDPQTGVYRDNASIAASGNISFDSVNNQKLDGSIRFANTPVSWFSPFLSGILSKLSGTLDGNIGLTGTSFKPVMDGALKLNEAHLRLDYLGCNYTIPTANISIDNHRINFGEMRLYDEYKNKAILNGYMTHDLFKDMRIFLMMKSKKIEVMNLTSTDNNVFYGNIIAGLDSFVLRGPFNNLKMNAYNVVPSGKSHMYIPLSTTGDFATYNYISFQTYGKLQDKYIRKAKSRMEINIDANLNDLAEMTIIIDPETGDAINAKGEGNIQLNIPTNNDMRINGRYGINEGDYTFSFKQQQVTFLKKVFKISDGSNILFNGPVNSIEVNVDAIYPVKARYVDLLSTNEKALLSPSELSDAQPQQLFDVILHMRENLTNPKLTFNLKPEDDRSIGTYPYLKLQQMDQIGDRDLLDEVTALLLIGAFVPSNGLDATAAGTGAINDVTQLLSGTASTELTNAVNKILGNKQVNIAVKYTNFNSDANTGAGNLNQFNLDVSKNYLDDRLIVDLGSTSDWGRPASTAGNTGNFNVTGDFRIQYQIKRGGNTRLNCFRSSDYDVSLDRYITRSGVGISWRKSFDNFHDFFAVNDKKKKKEEQDDADPVDSNGKK